MKVAIPMHISPNVRVSSSDGPCGQSTRLILKPTTPEITHLVVRNEQFPETEYLVSLDQVAESTPEQIRLSCTCAELSKMPVFDQIEFVPSGLPGFPGSPYMLWPYNASAATYTTRVRYDSTGINSLMMISPN
jgi:hypothetical protein